MDLVNCICFRLRTSNSTSTNRTGNVDLAWGFFNISISILIKNHPVMRSVRNVSTPTR